MPPNGDPTLQREQGPPVNKKGQALTAFERVYYENYKLKVQECNKVRKEGRKQTGLAREDSGEFYLQINLNRCALCAS